jgi:hypothetical protein
MLPSWDIGINAMMLRPMNQKNLCLQTAIIVTLFLCPCVAQEINAQQLIPFEQNEKWGFINTKGDVMINPRFDEVRPFSEGLALVRDVDLKYGFIDATGKVVIELQYRCAFGFSEGLAPVAKDCGGLWEYIDHKGNIIIPAKFQWAGNFSDGLAEVLVAPDPNAPNIDKSGYIDKTGKIVIEAKFGWAEQFSDGLALVADDKPNSYAVSNPKAFIDKKGNRVTDFFDDAESFSEGLAAVRVNWLWGFINKTGTIVIPPAYDFISTPFSEGYAAVHCNNDKIAFIDRRGKKITECLFSEVGDFSEGLALVAAKKGWGFINTKGKFAIKPQFNYADSFLNGLAKVRLINGNWVYEGYINHQGEYVVKPVKKKRVEEDNNDASNNSFNASGISMNVIRKVGCFSQFFPPR